MSIEDTYLRNEHIKNYISEVLVKHMFSMV